MESRSFSIIEVARHLGLDIRTDTLGRDEVRARCPFCDDQSHHLYLNRISGMYHCARCDHGGTSAVSLYAETAGLRRRDAVARLLADGIQPLSGPVRPAPINRRPPASLAQRHDVYYGLLQLLGLTPRHAENLRRRGLTMAQIERNMYRSLPVSSRQRDALAGRLSQNHDLRGVPGFFTRDGRWRLWGKPGFLIPCCTPDGYIQSLQIRRDEEDDGKYLPLSSNFLNGAQAYSWVHVTGDTAADTAYVTEGYLKADVASFLSGGALFIGNAGTGNMQYFRETVQALHIKRVISCYDMDQLSNPHVQKARLRAENVLKELEIPFSTKFWDPRYNGIDDYYLHNTKPLSTAA